MTREEATAIVGALIALTGSYWDEAATDVWLRKLLPAEGKGMPLDADCAEEATNLIIDTWTEGNRPSWARWYETYASVRRRRLSDSRGLNAATEQPMSPDEAPGIRAAITAAMRAMSPLQHDHKTRRITDKDGTVIRTLEGAEGCSICSGHTPNHVACHRCQEVQDAFWSAAQ